MTTTHLIPLARAARRRQSRLLQLICCLALSAGLSACSSDDEEQREPDVIEAPDAAEPDAAEPDAGDPDADAEEPDAGESDAEEPDAGEEPAGSLELVGDQTSYAIWSGSDGQPIEVRALDADGEEVAGDAFDPAQLSWSVVGAEDGEVIELGDCASASCEFSGVAPGEVELRAEAPGYAPVGVEIEVVGVKIAQAGSKFSCAIDTRGALYCWGYNFYTNLGDGTSLEDEVNPVRIGDPALKFKQLSLTSYPDSAGCAVTEDGQLYCWGENTESRLGLDFDSEGYFVERSTLPERVQVEGDEELKWEKVSVGKEASCGLSEDGEIYCWGLISSYMLGTDPYEATSELRVKPSEPVKPPSEGGEWIDVSASYGKVYALSDAPSGDNTYMWGSGPEGIFHPDPKIDPTPVDMRLTQLTRADEHMCGLTDDAMISCWGEGTVGYVALNSACEGQEDCELDTPSTFGIEGSQIEQVSTGEEHLCMLNAGEGEPLIYCWGDDSYGRLGNSANPPDPAEDENQWQTIGLPVQDQDNTAYDWAAVSAGMHHTCATTQRGLLYCWGELLEDRPSVFKQTSEPERVEFPALD